MAMMERGEEGAAYWDDEEGRWREVTVLRGLLDQPRPVEVVDSGRFRGRVRRVHPPCGQPLLIFRRRDDGAVIRLLPNGTYQRLGDR